MKKVLFVLFFSLIAVSLLFSTGQEEEVVTLTLALGTAEPEMITNLVNKFNEEHPNIKIDWINVPTSMEEYLQPKAAAGIMPDIFTINGNPFGAKLADEGIVADLSDTETAKNILDSVIPQFTSPGGKYFGFSGGVATTGFYYQTKIFDDLGLTPPENWEDYLALCEKIKKAEITPQILGVAQSMGNSLFSWGFAQNVVLKEPDYFQKFREGTMNINTPEVADIFNKVKIIYDKGYTQKGAISTDYMTGNTLFIQGKGAMHTEGVWIAGIVSEADFEWKLFLPPVNPKGQEKKIAVIASETGYGVAEGPHKKEAKIFLDWMYGPGFGLYQNPRQNVPPLKKIPSGVEIKLPQQIKDYMEEINKFNFFGGLYFEYLPSEAMGLINKLFQEVLMGEITPEQAAEALDTACRNAIAK